MTTRRNILKGGAGLAAILASGKAPAYIVKSMLAARGSFFGRGGGAKGWVNPYVTDGLVAMWDGEWNAGGGLHDENNRLLNIVKDGLFGDISGGAISSDNLNITTRLSSSVSSALTDYMTVEVCVDYTNSSHTSSVIFLFPSTSTAAAVGAYSWNSAPFRMLRSVAWNTLQPTIVDDRLATTMVIAFRKASGQTSSQMLYSMGFTGEYKITASDNTWESGYAISGNGNLTIGTNGLQMKIHSIRIYNRALTANEIAANYAVDKARFNLA